MSAERYCPECGEAVPAGIVRHRDCYLKAAEVASGKTERDWYARNFHTENLKDDQEDETP